MSDVSDDLSLFSLSLSLAFSRSKRKRERNAQGLSLSFSVPLKISAIINCQNNEQQFELSSLARGVRTWVTRAKKGSRWDFLALFSLRNRAQGKHVFQNLIREECLWLAEHEENMSEGTKEPCSFCRNIRLPEGSSRAHSLDRSLVLFFPPLLAWE